VEVPLPWERPLWTGRPVLPFTRLEAVRERYVLTDVRLVRVRAGAADELAVHDIGDVHRTQSAFERCFGLSTIEVRARDPRRGGLVLRGIRHGAQVAALLELLSAEPRARIDLDAARAAFEWEPRFTQTGVREGIASLVVVAIAVLAAVIGLRGKMAAPVYAPDDPIYPGGRKREASDIVRFMQDTVMPWAQQALGPIKGGADRVTCETCHGNRPESRNWTMPAVAALPQPDVRDRGWEIYSGTMDAQMRNAIYGYLADSDKQAKAAYMREIVMPGMATLLRRPAYDYTRSYEYNRSRLAFGCYHCHLVR